MDCFTESINNPQGILTAVRFKVLMTDENIAQNKINEFVQIIEHCPITEENSSYVRPARLSRSLVMGFCWRSLYYRRFFFILSCHEK